MLSEIMKQFKQSRGPMHMSDLSDRIGVDRSALDGMILQLVRQGKLKEIDPTAGLCGEKCGSCSCCSCSSSPVFAGKTYEIVIPQKGI